MSIHQTIDQIIHFQHESPHDFLGAHQEDQNWLIRVYEPDAKQVTALIDGKSLVMPHIRDGIYILKLDQQPQAHYQLKVSYSSSEITKHDPYNFLPSMGELDLYLLQQGNHQELYKALGSELIECDGISGVRFSVWAPEAKTVAVIGNFNSWNNTRNPLRKLMGSPGIWEIFIPNMNDGEYYKFAIRSQSDEIIEKQDPIGNASELRPGTASIVCDTKDIQWSDQAWLKDRADHDILNKPLSIYEIHLGSWNHPDLKKEGEFANYRDLAHCLADYICDLAYTHVELMPITEFPYDPSWGYQATGYFAPTSRFGTPQDFAYFVDHLHSRGIGVIIDWVPAHFPTDKHALGKFDGSSLYEHDNPDEGYHPDWNTYIFNFGRTEVANFLISSALYWLQEFHIDGLRVDAVASMLYRDYSREEGQWRPNHDGGRENYEAIEFMKKLNQISHEKCPGSMIIAEESTAFPKVSKPLYDGGLGFTMKWNMGWMHDTLKYFSVDPVHRKYHHNQLTFSLVYAFHENFVLPLSHDEVVHGKGSLINKMPGDTWQKFANLRALYAYMYAHPGKKLMFMGGEIAQWHEWGENKSLDWPALQNESHLGIQNLTRSLNTIYRDNPCLWEIDFSHEGFEWLDTQDWEQSVLSFMRVSQSNKKIVCVMNLTPVTRYDYSIGVPESGDWEVILNSDDTEFGGSNACTTRIYHSFNEALHGQDQHIKVALPPLSVIYLKQK